MDYLLSKLLPWFVYPFGFSLLLMGLGLLALVIRHRARALVLWAAAILVLWISSSPWFSDALMGLLEKRYPPVAVEALPQAEAIVVLGGVIPGVVPGTGIPELEGGVDRLIHALRLYKAGKAPLVLLSGGAASGLPAESELMARTLEWLGVPRESMLLETRSRNTRQNALYSEEILKGRGADRILLVTSAFHMKRTQAVFESVGLSVVPAATDYQVVERSASVMDWLPDPSALYRSTLAIKEFLGWWVYRWRGWIAAGSDLPSRRVDAIVWNPYADKKVR